MEIDPLCTVFIKNEPDAAFPLINVDIKKEEVDLGEDSIVVSDEDDDSFLCPECAFTTHSEPLFLLHCKHHQDSDKKALTCAECEYATTHKGEFNIHLMTKHPTVLKPVICKTPDLKAKSEAAKEPQPSPELRCGECDFSTTSKRELCCHILLNQSHKLDDEFRCGGRCPFKTFRNDDLIRHIYRLHPTFYNQIVVQVQTTPKREPVRLTPSNPDPVYKCSMCAFQGSRRLLASHIAKEHTDLKVGQPIKWYKCGRCGIRMRYEERIAAHLIICKGPHLRLEYH